MKPKRSRQLSAAFLATFAFFAVAAITCVPRPALAAIGVSQASLIQSQLGSTLSGVTGRFYASSADRDLAIEMAIAQVEETAIATYCPSGPDQSACVSSVTSAVLAAPALAGLSPKVIGSGLGRAATTIARTNLPAALAIATTVANEGPDGSGAAFAATVIELGGPQSLAFAAGSPYATSATGSSGQGSNNNGPNNGFGGGAPGGGGCPNPSCT